jgi:hypothetical protein
MGKRQGKNHERSLTMIFKNFSKKILKVTVSFLIILTTIFALFAAYIASLIIAKPREIQFLGSFIESSIKSYNENINFEIGNAIISWDNKDFTFKINLKNVTFEIKNEISILAPNIIIDISRRSLLFGNVDIDNLILTGAKIEIEKLKNSGKFNLEKLSQLKLKLPINFKNLEIYSAEFLIKNSITKIKSLIFETQNTKNLFSLIINHDQEMVTSNAECKLSLKNEVESCIGEVLNINNHFINSIFNQQNLINSKFSLNTNFDLDFIQETISFELISENGNLGTQKESKLFWDELYIKGLFDFKQKTINLQDVKITNQENKLSGSINLNILEEYLLLNINSFQGNNIFLFNVWPNQVTPKLLGWLNKNIKSLKIDNSNLNLGLNLKTKQINDFYMKLEFSEANIKFAPMLSPLTNGSGEVMIKNNILSINAEKGNLEKVNLIKANATIENIFEKKTHNLIANIETLSDASEITKYIANNNLNKFNFSGEVLSKIQLNIPIKKGTSFDSIIFSSTSEVKNLNFKYFLKNSDVFISLSKSSNDNFIINSQIDCKTCNLDIPALEYSKEIAQQEKFKFEIDANPNDFRIININNSNNKKLRISGNIYFNEFKQFDHLTFNNVNIANSNFDLKISQRIDSQTIDISAKALDIDLKKTFLTISNKTSSPPTQINIDAKEILVNGNKFAQDFNIKSFFRNEELLRLVTLSLISDKKTQPYIRAKQKNSFFNQKNYLDIEISDIGTLLKNLNIPNSIQNGSSIINLTEFDGKTKGEIYINNLEVRTNKTLAKINEIISLGIVNSDFIFFEKSNGSFEVSGKTFQLQNFRSIGSNIGYTSNGYLDFDSNLYKFEGVVVPASGLNSLLGIKNIPVIGKIVTGGKDEGIISATYKASGSFDGNHKFKINPLSTLTPGVLRKIFQLPLKEN